MALKPHPVGSQACRGVIAMISSDSRFSQVILANTVSNIGGHGQPHGQKMSTQFFIQESGVRDRNVHSPKITNTFPFLIYLLSRLFIYFLIQFYSNSALENPVLCYNFVLLNF